MKLTLVLFKGTDLISWIIRKRAQWNYSIPYRDTYSHIGVLLDGRIWEARPSQGVCNDRTLEDIEEEYVLYETRFSLTENQIEAYRTSYRKELGKGYDFIGILGFIYLFKPIEDRRRWFCSELVIAKLREVTQRRILNKIASYKTSPTLLVASPQLKEI